MPIHSKSLLISMAVMLAATLMPASSMARSAWGNPLLLDTPQQPVPAMDFSTHTLSGRPVRLSDYRGKVVLLNFWATWCGPCLQELPALERLNRQLAGGPFVMLLVDVQEPAERLRRFMAQQEMGFDPLLDPTGEISDSYLVRNLPLTYILDKQGNVVHRAVGTRQWDQPAAVALLKGLMRQGSQSASRSTVAPRH